MPDFNSSHNPSWSPGRSGAPWTEITSAGMGKPKRVQDAGLHPGNVLIAKDLIQAIETDTRTQGSFYEGRAALEMILAVYESHRLKAPVTLPLKNREHPLKAL